MLKFNVRKRFTLTCYRGMITNGRRNPDFHIKNLILENKQVNEVILMGKEIRTEAVEQLFDAVLTLKDKAECYQFFEDLCTVNELLSLAQRLQVAKMLREDHTYLEVAEKTGASTATISRVNRSLNYGNDGYDLVFAKMNDK